MESYSRMSEMNSLITELAKAGVIIDQDDFVEFIRTGKRPIKFLDKDTGKPVDPDSEKAKDAKHAFDVDDQIKNRPAPSMPNETPMLEDSKDDFVEYVTVPTNASEEEQALRKAYGDYLSSNPDADVTYEEFVTQDPKASQIKKSFAQKKAEPAAVEPIVEVIERPTPIVETPVVSDIEAKKAELKKQIEALPDDMIYGAHVTGDDVAKNIYDTQFKYSLGTALQGTIGLTSKKGLLDLMNNLLDGKSPHRNQFGVFILAFPKSEFGENSADRKVNLDTIESDMLDNYPEYLEGKIPTKFNFGYFKDGILSTKNAELATLEGGTIEPVKETPTESEMDFGNDMLSQLKDLNNNNKSIEIVQDLLNSVSSIRDLPNLTSSTANTLTTKIISLMRDNPGIKASDVAAMIDIKRKEFLEKLQTSDLKPGDIITFADGKKGMVKKSSNEEVTIKMPKVKDALVLNQQDLSKRITMVEAGTVAKAKKEAPMEITESDKVEVEASKDAVDGFTSNAAKVQELNKDILANTGKDNSANVNNLIDKLGCKTNAKK